MVLWAVGVHQWSSVFKWDSDALKLCVGWCGLWLFGGMRGYIHNVQFYNMCSQKESMYSSDWWHKWSSKPGCPRLRQLRGAHGAHVGTADGVLAHHRHRARPSISAGVSDSVCFLEKNTTGYNLQYLQLVHETRAVCIPISDTTWYIMIHDTTLAAMGFL